MHQLERLVVLDGVHQCIGHADRDVEILQVALVLGVDEALDVGMVAAQHAHLRAAPRAGRFHGLAGAVEHAHVGDRPAGAGIGALDLGALGTDRRKIVADAAAAPHGFGGLLQRIIDAGLAVDDAGDRIADRLHEAVDQRRLAFQPGCRVDPAGRHETVLLRLEEFLFPAGALFRFFGLGQAARHAAAHILDRVFAGLGVFFQQYFGADLLCHGGASLDSRIVRYFTGDLAEYLLCGYGFFGSLPVDEWIGGTLSISSTI